MSPLVGKSQHQEVPCPSPAPSPSALCSPPTEVRTRNCPGGVGRWECAEGELEAEEIQRRSVLLCFIVSMCAEFTWSFQF